MMRNARATGIGGIVLVGCLVASTWSVSGAETPLTTRRIVGSIPNAVFVTTAPGDMSRLFAVQQSGQIRIIRNGVLEPTPFISIPVTFSGERGLLGLAFDPDFAQNKYFYVNFVRDLTTFVSRFKVSDNDPDIADPASELVILTQAQPFANHNAGMLAFSPRDGYLYIGFGDGGSGNDPGNRAQNPGLWLGKMLRIDVRNARQGDTYEVPSDNPFIDDESFLPEIWALGVRNPWRYSFDMLTHDLYIADVGQNVVEEVDFQPFDSPGGENYGWRCMEGTRCTGLSGCTCNDPGLTLPIHEYTHGEGCSVSGGYVYRGPKIPDLQGTYFFADYCSRQIWSFRYANGQKTDFRNRTAELAPQGFSIDSISSFGQDANGEVYICDLGGEIFQIIPRGLSKPTQFVVTQGDLVEGVLPDLSESDESHVVVEARRPTEIASASAEIEVTGTASADNPQELRLLVEAASSGAPVRQQVRLFNYDGGAWETLDERDATPGDSFVNISVTQNAGRFIQNGTLQMRARIGHVDFGVTFPAWGATYDLVCWTVIP